MPTPAQIIDSTFALYERHGSDDYIGEAITQLEHMSQAAQLAMAEGFDDEVVLAAFVVSHERIGAEYLRRCGFGERMARLVQYHVEAKRYLTLRQPGYYQRLSEASRRTLEYQGGVMSEDEADVFERDPLFEVSLRMREWDEQAKVVGVAVIDLDGLKRKALALL
ncbi:MAG: phosphohydrolase [Pseudomonas asiatica]